MSRVHRVKGWSGRSGRMLLACLLSASGLAAAQVHRPAMPAQAGGGPVHAVARVAPVTMGARFVRSEPAHQPFRPRNDVRPPDRGSRERRANPDRSLLCVSSPNLSVQQLLSPFPANGFNFAHLGAIDRDLPIQAAIDPATQIALSEARQLSCGTTLGGGFLLWGGGYGYGIPEEVSEASPAESPSQAKPEVIVIQVPASAPPAEPKAAAAAPEPEAPLPDRGQFVLRLRDGSELSATAFMRSSDQLVYISPDGLRHEVPLANLDGEATRRLNREHGSQIALPF